MSSSRGSAASAAEAVTPYYRYWGKAGAEGEGPASVHLLPYHCLDVAAAGQALLEINPRLAEYLARLTGLDVAGLRRWAPFFLALHDIGKFADAFQNLRPDLRTRLLGRAGGRPYSERHDTLGYLLWRESLKAACRDLGLLPPADTGSRRRQRADGVDYWLRAVTGHHGRPPASRDMLLRDYFQVPDDVDAAGAFVADLRSLLLPDAGPVPALELPRMERASWWLAGFTVLCDWLGSGREPQHYEADVRPLDDYWAEARPWAADLVRQKGLMPATVSEHFRLSDCLPDVPAATVTPTPLQAAVEAVEIGNSPRLFILEDVTGAGKTEAALLLSHRLMQAGEGGGLYFGLPTMATSNAMYERLAAVYRRLFAADSAPSLVLAHSARALSEPFRLSRVDEPDYGDRAMPAGAECAAWLADNRKKALLTHVGVGTLDQALLAVLPSYHQSLRLLGLLGKVLIVDEVHACDAYMNGLLCGLLEAHAAAGGSAVLLSATLPAGQRRALVEAFANGLGEPASPPAGAGETLTGQAPYPLLTHFDGSRVDTKAVATPERVRRRCRSLRLLDPQHRGRRPPCLARPEGTPARRSHRAVSRPVRARRPPGDRRAGPEGIWS